MEEITERLEKKQHLLMAVFYGGEDAGEKCHGEGGDGSSAMQHMHVEAHDASQELINETIADIGKKKAGKYKKLPRVQKSETVVGASKAATERKRSARDPMLVDGGSEGKSKKVRVDGEVEKGEYVKVKAGLSEQLRRIK